MDLEVIYGELEVVYGALIFCILPLAMIYFLVYITHKARAAKAKKDNKKQ